MPALLVRHVGLCLLLAACKGPAPEAPANSRVAPVATTVPANASTQSLLAKAWTAALEDEFVVADVLVTEAERRQPGVATSLMIKIGERRNVRTTRLLAAGEAAIKAQRLRQADAISMKLERVAAQPSAIAEFQTRLFNAHHYGGFAPKQMFSDRLRDGSRGPELVVVPMGRFAMGDALSDSATNLDEKPVHEVNFSRGFAIARNEVTVGDFRRFVQATRYVSVATRMGHSTVYDEKGAALVEHDGVDWRRDHTGREAQSNLPVVHVAHADAVAYTRWLSAQSGRNYRLPSEAEFEYVLRGGSRTRYPWGDGMPKLIVANLAGEGDLSRSGRRWGNAIEGYRDAFWGPAPVRMFPIEGMLTYDMIGNVLEWTEDCWHESYQRAPDDGTAWVNPGCERRVVRGASWASSLERSRSSARLPMDNDATTARLGFRVVREL